MSEIIGTIGKYGLLGVLAAFVPAFVHGAMAGAIGLSDHPVIAMIQLLSYIAIVAYWGRHNVVDGLIAGVGIASGIYVFGIVTDLALDGMRWAFNMFVGLVLDYVIRGFLLGVAIGFFGGLAPSPIPLFGFAIGALIMLLVRAGGLISDALDLAISSLMKGINVGYAAILAPYLGGIVIGVPLSLALLVVGFGIALGIGIALGLALAAMLLGLFVVFTWGLVSLLLYLGLMIAALVIFKTFTRSRDLIEVVLDFGALSVFNFIGPALYAAGYAALVTRYKSTAVYYIALGALGAKFFGG